MHSQLLVHKWQTFLLWVAFLVLFLLPLVSCSKRQGLRSSVHYIQAEGITHPPMFAIGSLLGLALELAPSWLDRGSWYHQPSLGFHQAVPHKKMQALGLPHVWHDAFQAILFPGQPKKLSYQALVMGNCKHVGGFQCKGLSLLLFPSQMRATFSPHK